MQNYNAKKENSLCYKIPHWDYEQWISYINTTEEYQTIEQKVKNKNEMFPQFMAEVFQRLLRSDNVDLAYDTKESYQEKVEKWVLDNLKYQEDLDSSLLSESDYSSIFGNRPEKPTQVKPKNEIGWALKLHQELSESKEFSELMFKINSEFSHVKKWILSGTGALKFGEVLANQLPTQNQKLNDPEKTREEIRELKKELEQALDSDDKKVNELKEKIDELTIKGKKDVFDCDQYSKTLTPKVVENAIKSACVAATQEVQTMQDAMEFQSGWGAGEGSIHESGGVTEKIKSAKKLIGSKNFKKIVEKAGRLKFLAEKKRKSKTPVQAKISGVKTGNNLNNLLPSEYGKFTHPKTRKLFIKDFSENSLLEYDKNNDESSKKGPVIVLIDNSGSMDGEPEIWSKAVALAYLFICKKDKRDFYAIHFDERTRATYDFPKGKFDDVKIGNFVNFFSGGGTDWMKPLNDAVSVIEKSKIYKNADIILITDGDCRVSDDWRKTFNQKKNDLKFTSYGILLGRYCKKDSLDNFIDNVIVIPNLSDDSDVLEIF